MVFTAGQITVIPGINTNSLSVNVVLSTGTSDSDAFVQPINLTTAVDSTSPTVTALNTSSSLLTVQDGDSPDD